MSTESKHTPGPWRVDDAGPHSGNVIRFEIRSPDGGCVCEIEDPEIGDGLPGAGADARLIAAAPALLEAALAARDELCALTAGHDALDLIEKALALAEGKPNE